MRTLQHNLKLLIVLKDVVTDDGNHGNHDVCSLWGSADSEIDIHIYCHVVISSYKQKHNNEVLLYPI